MLIPHHRQYLAVGRNFKQLHMIPDDFSIDGGIIELQTKLNLPEDFFKKLLQEDDWSFIIKLHALVEAACTDILTHRFDEPNIRKVISRLELSNKSFGKLAFIKELELINEEYRRFISSLSEWRNNFVHNVQNCGATLPSFISTMSNEQIKKFALDFSPYEVMLKRISKGPMELFDEKKKKQLETNTLIKRAKENPKFHIWLGGYNLLVYLADKYSYTDYLKYDKAMTLTGLYDEDDENDPDLENGDESD